MVGGTGAGKTTLLRSLLSEVPQSELLVTIEDTLELHLRESGPARAHPGAGDPHVHTEGTGEISMYDLAKAALRMSPDRVIIGEVRGGEVMQLLQAMGIGNDGSLGTIHAGSTRAAINKMLIYAQRSPDAPTPDSVLREIAEVLHLLVYIKKLPDGRRAVTSIREVTGYDDGKVLTSEVFGPGPDGVGVYMRPFKPDGEALARLVASGFDPAALGEPYKPQPAVPRPRQAQPAQAPARLQQPQPQPQQGPARPQQPQQAPRPVQQPTAHPAPAGPPTPATAGRPRAALPAARRPGTRPPPARAGRPAPGAAGARPAASAAGSHPNTPHAGTSAVGARSAAARPGAPAIPACPIRPTAASACPGPTCPASRTTAAASCGCLR